MHKISHIDGLSSYSHPVHGLKKEGGPELSLESKHPSGGKIRWCNSHESVFEEERMVNLGQ